MITEFADLEEHSCDFDCDGLASFSTSRPKIFIRRQKPHRRKRFTKAHELGHVVLFWHQASVSCQVNPANVGQSPTETVMQEREANEFASHLLVPDAFLKPFGARYVDAPDLLDELRVADVSAAAGIMALQRVLLPGYVFEVPGLPIKVSSGTAFFSYDFSDYQKHAIRQGVHDHQQHQVRWCQLAEGQHLAIPAQIDRTTRSVLEEALHDYGHQDVPSAAKSVYCVVGGVLSKRQIEEPGHVLGLLRHKFAFHDQYADLARHPGFADFLELRAVEMAEKARRTRGRALAKLPK